MTHKTKGIVLRVTKYGETSVIASIFTELFGIQSYLINGVRKLQKTNKSIMLQPSAILDLEVYHHENKNLQRIKEYNWSVIYNELLSDVLKNSIVTYMMELLQKTLKEPESNPTLFYFCEDVLMELDKAHTNNIANFPLYFTLQLPQFFGFGIQIANQSDTEIDTLFLDLRESLFADQKPLHRDYLEGIMAQYINELLKIMHPSELNQVKLNKDTRRLLLEGFHQYYQLHIDGFGNMKTLKILQEVLS